MARNVFDIPFGELETWHAGDPPSAKKLNQTVGALNALRGTRPPRQVGLLPIPLAAGTTIQRFQYVGPFGDNRFDDIDAIVGNAIDEDGEVSEEYTTIALPWLLRMSPFHGSVRFGISYNYRISQVPGSDPQPFSRLATGAGDLKEWQQVITSYQPGDVLFAARDILAGTGVEDAEWLDLNVDGRAWARVRGQT